MTCGALSLACSVYIVNDNVREGLETFTLMLTSGEPGVVLPSPNNIIVTITDHEDGKCNDGNTQLYKHLNIHSTCDNVNLPLNSLCH